MTASRDDGGSLFAQPLFEDPSARALSRVGVIDIGSNSVRLVVFDGAARSPAYFFNEKVLCGLGRGMAETGRLDPTGRERALAALRRFALLAEGMDLSSLITVATAAMRDAEDGPDFGRLIEAETGLTPRVIDGTEEARLSAQGVLLGWPEASGLVCDIGGSSMELATIGDGRVHGRATTALGPFRLQRIPGGKKGLKAHIRDTLEALRSEVGDHHERLYLVGGSWRAIARLDMLRRGYPLTVLHEYAMTPKSIRKTLEWIDDCSTKPLRKSVGISAERMALVPLAGQVLRRLLQVFGPQEVRVSAYGIREGMLYEQMPEQLRRRDPLIEACRFSENTGARMPGFGRKLFAFLQPLYKSASPARLRLVKAACLLHDVNWRAHPDYRSEACFDAITRANLGALDHRGRVFLGVALMHRYKNNGTSGRMSDLMSLLSERERNDAEVLGRAMRFGAMFSIAGPDTAGSLRYYPKKEVLELVLTRRAQGLFSEVAEQRFASLAKALGVTTRVRVGRGT
ncbi:exopolyphosphatase [Rhodobacteraceae bacterium WD3A24]|nr:exopolyphosphatase [Rhodobacteraceae bacterium WD3A24]